MKRKILVAALLLMLWAAALAEALPDGTYTPAGFSFSGGSGRVTIECPGYVVSGGAVTATLVFSSPNYPRLAVDGAVYEAAHGEGTSVFEVPVPLDRDVTVVGTTTAMSEPHDVEYTIHIHTRDLPDGAEATEAPPAPSAPAGSLADRDRALPGLVWQSELPLRYADQFAVDRYEGGYRLLSVADGNRYLVIPEGKDVPAGLDGDIRLIRRPLKRAYLAATAAMALFDAVDGLDAIAFSGTRREGWTVENAAAAMARGDIVYAGKYSAPDYELLMGGGCQLAIESTMILHAPKVREMLERLGIPVFIERSSYESHPLGRTEWVKLYAAMIGREEAAEAFFDGQARVVEALKDFPNTEKTVAFFYIASDGSAVVRGAGDYVAGMIELAGGRYAFGDALPGDSRASVTLSMEDFYAAAVDADLLIYNAAIDAPPESLEALLRRCPLLKDFRAVGRGDVWTTDRRLYQATDTAAQLIADIHRALTGGQGEMAFIRRLE